MNWRRYVRDRLPRLETSPERELEIVEELAAQLEATYARAIASGAAHDEALRIADGEVPDWEALAHTLARIEGQPAAIPSLPETPRSRSGAVDDFRYAIRSCLAWRALPAALVMLALSTGSVLVVAAAIDSWLLQRPRMAHADRLALVWGTNQAIGQARDVVSGPTFLDLQRRSRTIDGMAAFAESEMTIRGSDRADLVSALAVTPEFFAVLGVRAAAGRTFQAADQAAPGGVAMISHGAWRSRFGGDPAVAGRSLAAWGQPHVIVGVLPPGFHLLGSPDVVTLLDPRSLEREERSHYYYWIVARLVEGRTFAEAQRELDAIMTALADEHPGMRGWTATVEPLFRTLAEPVRPALTVLLAISLLVLAVGAANTANLVASRAIDKRRDLAIRSALGASSARLRRQCLIDGGLIALAGTTAGCAVAAAALRAAGQLAPGSAAIAGSAATVELPPLQWGLSAPPLALLMALLLAMILGAVPLRKADPSDLGRVNHGARAGSMLLTRGRRGLLAAQTAIATVLLAVAGLLLAVVLQLMATSPGFDAAHVTAMIVGRVHDLDAGGRARYYSSVLAAVAGLPGVTSAALNDYVPLTNEDDYEGLEIPGRPRDGSGQLPREEWRRVSAGYFQTMRIPLVRGRLFTAADDERAESVVVINESLAGKYFAGGNPIGQRIRITSTPYGWSEIVGIVGDVREAGLDRAPKPMMFVPYHRDPRPVMGLFVARPTESETMTRAIADAVRSIDPGRPVFEARSMSGIVADSYAIQRSTLGMAAGLASLALLLMLGGTYAVVDLVAAARAREIALRVALGAGRADVLGAVLGQPCAAAIAGIAVGLALAWAAASALPSLVGGVRPLDAPLAAGVAFLVGLAVGAACLAPARRALRVDPAVALRGE